METASSKGTNKATVATLPDAASRKLGGLPGFGAVGDSVTRGYFGRNDYPANHNWVELLVALRGLNFGAYGVYPDPQDQTYAHVWAAGSANAFGAKTNQAPGLVKQIAAGDVGIACLEVGSHDYGPTGPDPAFAPMGTNSYGAIYAGTPTAAQMATYMQNVVGMIEDAGQMLLDAGAKLVLANIPDFGATPSILKCPLYSNQKGRTRVADAASQANEHLRAWAITRDVPRIDFFGFVRLALDAAPVTVGPVTLNKTDYASPSDPHDFFLDSMHPGTIVSGLFANVFLGALEAGYRICVPPLSDQEIVTAAGLNAGAGPATYYDVARFVEF